MSSEVLIEKGRAPYKFETGNAESPFLRTLDPADNGKERIYWRVWRMLGLSVLL